MNKDILLNAQHFIEQRFCIQSYDPSKMKLADLDTGNGNFTHKKWVDGTVFLVYDNMYEFIYNVDKKEFGEWLGHFEDCCRMSCDYYGCSTNYK